MADTDTPPQQLVDAQRAFDAASATLLAAPKDLPADERQQLRDAEMSAARALWAARSDAGLHWATDAGRKTVEAAARA